MGRYYSPAAMLIFLSIAVYTCRVSSNGCAAYQEDEELRKARLEQLKGSIMAQLGFAKPPVPETDDEVIPATLEEEKVQNKTIEEYWDMLEGTTSHPKCRTDDFYAKPISSFIGSMSPTEGLALRFRRQVGEEPLSETNKNLPGNEGGMAGDEEEQEEVAFEGNILNQYTIHLHMNLPENLSMIAKANLLLHQAETDTINNPVLDEKQLIQIRAIINNIRYFVDKKSLSVYGSGPQLFDVLRAMELWVEGGRTGELLLEVLVTCSSSPNCSSNTPYGGDMKPPGAVAFEYNATHSSKVPRVITLSKNPLEAANIHFTRKKRQASPPERDQYCHGNETTCCLHPLNINFVEDLNIHFIRFPLNFTTNYCDGYCPMMAGLGNPSRAQLLRFLRESPATTVEPCCSGIEYMPLQVLMYLYNPEIRRFTLKIEILEQVIVTRCRCS